MRRINCLDTINDRVSFDAPPLTWREWFDTGIEAEKPFWRA